METNQIEKEVKKAICKVYGEHFEIKNSDRLKNDIGLDSLDMIEAIMTIELNLHINIPDAEIEEMKTVQDLIDSTAKQIER